MSPSYGSVDAGVGSLGKVMIILNFRFEEEVICFYWILGFFLNPGIPDL